MFRDGDNGENFMTVLRCPDYTIRLSNSTGTFPKIWKEERQPTIDKYVMQKLNELEQEIKKLKEELERLRL